MLPNKPRGLSLDLACTMTKKNTSPGRTKVATTTTTTGTTMVDTVVEGKGTTNTEVEGMTNTVVEGMTNIVVEGVVEGRSMVGRNGEPRNQPVYRCGAGLS
jgi:hypothetical protein